jgi:hypothetical protein
MSRRGKPPILMISNIMVEEAPVAKYRKQIIARLNQMDADSPEALENRFRRGKYSYAKRPVFPQNTHPCAMQNAEKPQNSRVQPEGNNLADLENTENIGSETAFPPSENGP